jgi:hypothetical protein
MTQFGQAIAVRQAFSKLPGAAQRWGAALGNGHSIALGLPAAAAAGGVIVAAVHAMVLDGSGCSRISCSCHSACEF